MKRFEYRTLHEKNGFTTKRELDEFGKDGWELVSVCQLKYSGAKFFFKRELEEKKDILLS